MKVKIDHVGFCLGDYEDDVCNDCPSLADCLKMYINEHPVKEEKKLDFCDINPRIPCSEDCPGYSRCF